MFRPLFLYSKHFTDLAIIQSTPAFMTFKTAWNQNGLNDNGYYLLG